MYYEVKWVSPGVLYQPGMSFRRSFNQIPRSLKCKVPSRPWRRLREYASCQPWLVAVAARQHHFLRKKLDILRASAFFFALDLFLRASMPLMLMRIRDSRRSATPSPVLAEHSKYAAALID